PLLSRASRKPSNLCWPFRAEFSLLSVWTDLRTNGKSTEDGWTSLKTTEIEMRPLCRINSQNLVSVASCSTCCAPASTTLFHGTGGASSEKFVRTSATKPSRIPPHGTMRPRDEI